ncbi:hypothetical protein THAOC_27972 [Thalassiosira oceanica]|uniref:Reverse transcriptase RNase H-like domain-containing protein n=1 Tax=Thalassiosira oceanica TaxID=159749 RepID=K0RHM3_THAOC|nr:hypothetical protein THAOC_27972 [Thalassiosira oceanica]|eukprot:EJK52725.1 hypothetical protein THAOC_27972 [Thalassiosira oceanica]
MAPSEIWTDVFFLSGVLSCLLADDYSRGPFEYDVLDGKVGALDGKMGALDGKVGALDEVIKANVKATDDKMKALETKLGSMESMMSHIVKLLEVSSDVEEEAGRGHFIYPSILLKCTPLPKSNLVLSLNDRFAHSAPRGDSSRTMGPRKPVEGEPSISVEADCPKSGLGIPAGPLMTGVGAPLSTPLRPVMDRLTGIERPCEPSPTSYARTVGELVVDLLDISQVMKQAAKAHGHAPEGVARRGFDCPMRREMTAYGDGLGARGSLPLPLGLDSLYFAADCWVAYPNHNKAFYIYTDASDYQLEAVIMTKLHPTQRNCSTIEKELLLIVMTLKTYKTMPYGADLQIYIDHKTLLFKNFNTMQRVVHNRSPEFKANFQTYVKNDYQVKTVQTTAHNRTQANAICERMHITVQQLINIYQLLLRRTREDARAIVDRALSTASHALRINISRSLGNNTPGALAFGRDTLLDLPFIADWQAVRENRRLLIDENLRRSNQKRRTFDYQPGQQVLKRRPGILRKLGGPRFDGPFEIVSVHVNGNATIRLSPSVTERVNIRRLKPYRVP